MAIDKRVLGDELAKLRAQSGLSQSNAAAALGLSDKAISKWETGATCPPLETLSAAAQLYGTTASELIARVESTKRPFTCIALSGGPCAGKSAALAYLHNALAERGWNVLTVRETATELMEAGVSASSCGSQEAFQANVFNLQIAKENASWDAARNCTGDRTVVICDRGLADNAAYLTNVEYAHILDQAGMSIENVYDRYDAVFFLDSAACGNAGLYTTENNASRLEDTAGARKSNERTLQAWEGHANLTKIAPQSDFNEKMQILGNELLAFLGLAPLPAKSRTMLTRKPDIKHLLNRPNCVTSHHVVTFISAADDRCSWIEAAETNDTLRFTKYELVDGAVRPVCSPLTQTLYNLLSKHADPNFAPLESTRFSFAEDDTVCHVNLYSFFPYQAIVEVAGPEGSALKPPAFIQSIRDVTDNEVYTARGFSRALAQGRL